MTPSQPDPHDPIHTSGPNPLKTAFFTVLKPLASLQLTVVLLALGVGLVFFGTLAQKTAGMWTVVDRYFWSWVVMIDLQPTYEFLKIFFGLSKDAVAPSAVKIPYPGGITIGGLMFVNLLAAHALRFKLTWKRAGIWMAHSGILLLLVGEAITRECQVEQRMTIQEGEAVNFTEDHQLVELAFVTPEPENTVRMTVIPGTTLARAAQSGRVISHPDLPVDVRVDQYMPNSSMLFPDDIEARKAEGQPLPENPATAGLGLKYIAQRQNEVSGVNTDEVNLPTVYVTLLKKGTEEKIGTYLGSLWFTQNPFTRARHPKQPVTADGTTFDLSLRYQRYYKPFSMYLRKFRFDRYTGTEQAKNYSSDLTLVDPERGQSRDVHIEMNDPLRYRGETFYQQNFDKTTEKATVLQVVRNPGWLLPYLACVMVGVGLLFHFVLGLVRYLLRQKTEAGATSGAEALTLMTVVFAIVALAVRFGLLASWMDAFVGPVGSGGFLAGQLFGLFVLLAAGPAVAVYLLVQRNRGAQAAAPVVEDTRTGFERWLPWGVVGLGTLMLAGAAMPRSNAGAMDLAAAARLPVVDGGRIKPLDTVARVYLRKISTREQFVAADGKMHPAIEWYMDAASSPGGRGPAAEHKVIRIENEQVLSLLGLERREGYRYSLEEVIGKRGEKMETLQAAMDKARPREGAQKPPANDKVDRLFESGDRDVFAAQVMETAERVQIYMKLCSRTVPLTLPPAAGEDWRSFSDVQRLALLDAVEARGGLPPMIRPMSKKERLKLPPDVFEMIVWRVVGNLPEEESEQFNREVLARVAADPGAMKWVDVIAAYRKGDAAQFSAALAAFKEATADGTSADDKAKVRFEVFLNEFAPAYQVITLYALAGILALAGWVALSFRRQLGAAFQKASFWLLVVTFVLHGFALFARMYLMDRPMVFVTNLYSTAVFIGWSAVGLGLVMERIAPIGLGNLAAAVVGGATAIIAHNLALSSSRDTLEMMEAVLDTNFWLATHVTTINLGYAATYVAGVIGIIYIALGLFTPLLGRPVAGGTGPNLGRVLGQLVYGVICLATLLSFVGTVLGGIWADQSWGRFWGWDPKENGAVLIVLCNALILHARWCGLVKDRGVAVLALVGNMVTTWSYFGTNQLQVGLHAYGFNKDLADGCKYTWLVHLVLIGIGLIPLRYWRSFAGTGASASQAEATATEPAVATAEPVSTQAAAAPAVNGTDGHATNGTPPKTVPGKGKKHKRR